MLSEVQRPRPHPALLQVLLVEVDLLGLVPLQLQLIAAVQHGLLVLPLLLLERQFVLLPAVFPRAPDGQRVLPAGAPVQLDVDVHAALLREDLLGGAVVDRLQSLLVVDVLLVPAQPYGPGDLEAGRGAQRALPGHGRQDLLFGGGALGDGEPAGHRPGRLLQLGEQQPRHVPVAAGDEERGVGDLPGEVDGDPELEGVVVAGQR
ncbi:hypothetical protein [Streptomyces sp. XD-27]|uniref:hypothetical protein n=1 Tax=Streptomyces sp. XD-27 TaxID=3062779 RepID=UPI0026F47374|nr:hypothetical protein [Streptomyces sp. XD-27]WKX71990.1 hypothetical protein Q3Y56_20675 [Streptomyces sp. XD-27]